MEKNKSSHHPFAYNELSKIIHEQVRLSILTALFNHPTGYSFNELKELCNLSDGNLSKHLKVLSENNFIVIEKSFKNNKSFTHCQISKNGREDFLKYLQKLEQIVSTNKKASREWNDSVQFGSI